MTRQGLLDVLFDHHDVPSFNFWRHLVGYLVIAVGSVYTGMGLLCFRQLKQVAVTKVKRLRAYREEGQQFTAHRMEIERLLHDTEAKLQLL